MVGLNAGGEKVIGSSQCFSIALRIEIHFSFSVFLFFDPEHDRQSNFRIYTHILYTPNEKLGIIISI